MEEEAFRTEYHVIFRCSVCNEGKESLEKLEAHLWNCHLREFPYRCALCGYPSLSSETLCMHFEQVHDRSEPVVFKRSIVNELRLREMISRSLLMEEQIYDSMEVPGNDEEESLEQIPIMEQSQMQHIVPEGESTIETSYETVTVNGFERNPVGEQVIKDEREEDEVIAVEDEGDGGVYVAHTSYGIFEDEEYGVQYIDEEEIQLDAEHLLTEENSFQENVVPRLGRLSGEVDSDNISVKRVSSRKRATIHQCEDCGKVLKYPSKIAEHRRSHTKEKPHVCPDCGASFSQKGALKCHKRLHSGHLGERPYSCTWECGRSFVSASARLMHEKMHSGEKRHLCSICGRLFGKKFHFQRHISTVHSALNLISEKSTGLDAAGEDAGFLTEAVTSVIEDVRKAKMKKRKQTVSESTGFRTNYENNG